MASTTEQLTRSTLIPSEVELINRVHSHFPENEPNKFHFFYRTASPFSNFHPCSFSENGIQFHSSEQYMMYHKASKEKSFFCPLKSENKIFLFKELFGDDETAEAVLQAKDPADCKALGRGVKNFDTQLWMDNRTRIVSDGLYLKV
jgi:predicted NAD-dependent protein-ADP-ribosyltransferase YbiA (DUF1768 family)